MVVILLSFKINFRGSSVLKQRFFSKNQHLLIRYRYSYSMFCSHYQHTLLVLLRTLSFPPFFSFTWVYERNILLPKILECFFPYVVLGSYLNWSSLLVAYLATFKCTRRFWRPTNLSSNWNTV